MTATGLHSVVLLAALLSGFGAPAAAGAAAKAATAGQRLAEARAAAARWRADAVLVSVTALRVSADGTAPRDISGWVYTFHSPGAVKWAGFHAEGERLERQDLPSGLTAPLAAQFVDSDVVLAEVRRNGFAPQGDAMATLMLHRDPALPAAVYWCVAGPEDISVERGVRGYCVHPATGRYAGRQAGAPAATSAKAPARETRAVNLSPDLARCAGFTASDAAAALGVSAAALTPSLRDEGGGRGSCAFRAPGAAAVVFGVRVWKSVGEAEAEMERVRRELGDRYSDIMGLGDDGLWAESDGSFTGRRLNVTIRVTQPADKRQQLKAAKAFVEKL